MFSDVITFYLHFIFTFKFWDFNKSFKTCADVSSTPGLKPVTKIL